MNSYTRAAGLVCLFLFVCMSKVLSQEEVSVSDFRYPETKALDWKGGLSGDFSSSETGYTSGKNNSANGMFSLSTSALFFHAKENHDNLIQLSMHLYYNQWKSDDVDLGYGSKSQQKQASVYGSWEYKQYLFDAAPLHVLGSASMDYHISISKDNTIDQTSSDRSSSELVRTNYQLSYADLLGIGYGRMRDGTFVIRTLRILERLREDGITTQSLSREQVLHLVDRIAKTREYTTNLERHEKYLVYDIVKELVADGVVLPENMAPLSILKMTEVLREQIEPRFFGWRVYYAFGFKGRQQLEDSKRIVTPYAESSDHDFLKDGTFIHRIAAEYGHAVSAWTHVTANATADIPKLVSSKFFSLNCSASVIYQIGERIDVIGRYTFLRTAGNYFSAADDRRYYREILHEFNATFRFFIEDQVSFSTSLLFSRTFEDRYASAPYPITDNSSQNRSRFWISFGINYNII